MKNTLVKRFVIGTFVSLYALVSIISTIHVIDFFELSNPYWLAVTLAIGFEIGAAASLASLVILKKMNKTIVWALFITITLMQMQGNMYYAFINLEGFTGWSELFDLIDEDLIDQKRILAFVSGAILPLIALGFIKSLVDYIKPEDEEEDERITEGMFDDTPQDAYDDGIKPSKEFYEDNDDTVEDMHTSKEAFLKELQDVGTDISDDETLNEAAAAYENASRNAEEDYIKSTGIKYTQEESKMWKALSEEENLLEDLDAIIEEPIVEEPIIPFHEVPLFPSSKEIDEIANSGHEVEDTYGNIEVIDPVEVKPEAEETITTESLPELSVESIVEKIASPHLQVDEDVLISSKETSINKENDKAKTENQLWKEAMDKKAKEEMDAFIKNKNESK